MTSVKNLELLSQAREDLTYWQTIDPKFASKIWRLFEDIRQRPFSGLGKPEPLKHKYSGCWSRRIDQEHRLIYRVEGNVVIILSCRYHYK